MNKRSTPQTALFLLATSLHRPAVSTPLVPRPRLLEMLAEGLSKRLTLISAPAHVHLVLTTRADPPLSLERLRGHQLAADYLLAEVLEGEDRPLPEEIDNV